MNTKTLKYIFFSCMLVIFLASCGVNEGSSNAADARMALVDHVEVQIGVGSPNPVTALISGSLPDTCSEFRIIRQSFEDFEFRFQIEMEQSRAIECIQDMVPFSLTIPLNMVNRPAGYYTVNAHTVSTSFLWPVPTGDTVGQSEDG